MDEIDLPPHAEHVGVFDAKTRLSELLDQVAEGAEVIITKHGNPVARLVPDAKRAPNAQAIESCFCRLSNFAASVALTSDEIAELKNHGRS